MREKTAYLLYVTWQPLPSGHTKCVVSQIHTQKRAYCILTVSNTEYEVMTEVK